MATNKKRTEVGKAIRIVRNANKMRLGDLAKWAKIATPFLSSVESGNSQPSLTVIARIEAALGIPQGVLLIMAGPAGNGLRTNNAGANRFLQALRNILEAEEAFRKQLKKPR